MDNFPLTDRDIHEGLTDERMSELVGARITSIPFLRSTVLKTIGGRTPVADG